MVSNYETSNIIHKQMIQMEAENLPKSLFEQIVDQTLKALRSSNEFNPELIQVIDKLAREEQLAKPASLVRVIKENKKDNK